MNKTIVIAVIAMAAIVVIVAGYFLLVGRGGYQAPLAPPSESELVPEVTTPAPEETTQEPTVPSVEEDIEIIAGNLQIPWEIVFLPDGDLLVTERPGTLKRIGKDKTTYIIEGVEHIGEGGLLGMALHPQFSENRWIYLYLTTKIDGGLKNRVERYRFENDRLSEKKIIINNIPGAAIHDGGRIAFGPDGYLYITTGDAGNADLAQDIDSLAGKILRLKDDGQIPPDNPFGNAIWSYGHRNPQGLAWDEQGRLWETEHGPSGERGLCCRDEINLIRPGVNYGWPDSVGDTVMPGTIGPVLHSGANVTWAPAGAAYLNSRLFFGGLRGKALYEAIIEGEQIKELKSHFKGEFGRIRAVVFGPDGYLYITTSNTDGRGIPKENDDRIIRINPNIFQ